MYDVIKASRPYVQRSYDGPSLEKAGLPAAPERGYGRKEDAILVAGLLTNVNPVGWQVFERATGKRVFKIGCK